MICGMESIDDALARARVAIYGNMHIFPGVCQLGYAGACRAELLCIFHHLIRNLEIQDRTVEFVCFNIYF